jgi:hypothetical protein
LNKIVLKSPAPWRRWHSLLARRLCDAGWSVRANLGPTVPRGALDRLLALEARRFGGSLATRDAPPAELVNGTGTGDAVVYLTTGADMVPTATPTFRLTINGHSDLAGGLAQVLRTGDLPELTLWLDDRAVLSARPMLSDRLWLSRMCDEILAGAVGLVESGLKRWQAGLLEPMEAPGMSPSTPSLMRYYLPNLVAQGARRAVAKLGSRRPFYWQVAYRPARPGIDPLSPGLGNAPFTVLPDDGTRFYADPFVIARSGGVFLFVEEFPYSLGRGIISVSQLASDGTFGTPREVLREPHHLSYPQVFEQEGDVFMLPESGGANQLVLYRAEEFPHRWARDTVLLDGVDVNDATVVSREGAYYLIGTERLGPGSASDRMVVYHSPTLRGPWTPHPLNPILIDRAGARPGGAVLKQDGRLWLKVQDGSTAYGGGLGLREIIDLNVHNVRFGPVVPIAMGTAWHRTGIHTLNIDEEWEVVDSAG